jgi:hypothetical protein
LQESLQAAGQKSSKRYPKYLKGKRIFYVGGDMQYAGERTRNRMEIVGAPFLLSIIPFPDVDESMYILLRLLNTAAPCFQPTTRPK